MLFKATFSVFGSARPSCSSGLVRPPVGLGWITEPGLLTLPRCRSRARQAGSAVSAASSVNRAPFLPRQ